jgi:predicted ribosome quality control (RQC) complex YloA/Tae2 family protein
LEVQTSSAFLPQDDEISIAGADANGDDRTEEIKAKIEETRADMGETIDAIQERLSYANISEQVSEQVSNAIETAKGYRLRRNNRQGGSFYEKYRRWHFAFTDSKDR